MGEHAGPQAFHPRLPMKWALHTVTSFACGGDGKKVVCEHTCYMYEDGHCFWNVMPCLHAFHAERKKVNWAQEAKKETAALHQLCERWSLPWTQLYKHPRRQAQCDSNIKPDMYTRSCQTFDTKLLVLLHLVWTTCAWKSSMKERAQLLLDGWFNQLAPTDAAAEDVLNELWPRSSAAQRTQAMLAPTCPYQRPGMQPVEGAHPSLDRSGSWFSHVQRQPVAEQLSIVV